MGRLKPVDPELDQYAKVVASQLGEENAQALEQINRAIQVVGMQQVCDLVIKATQAFESDDPPRTNDGKRQRTLGGCFFSVLKQSVNASTRRKIFPWHSVEGKDAQQT